LGFGQKAEESRRRKQQCLRISVVQVGSRAQLYFDSFASFKRRILARAVTDEELIPNREALDKILRYETTIDRSLVETTFQVELTS